MENQFEINTNQLELTPIAGQSKTDLLGEDDNA